MLFSCSWIYGFNYCSIILSFYECYKLPCICFYIMFFGSALALNRKQNISCRNSASKWGKLTLFWIRHSSHFCFPLALQNCSPWMCQCVPGVAAASYHLCVNQRIPALLLSGQDWPCCLHSALQSCSQGMATGFPSPAVFPGLCRDALPICELFSYSRRAEWS